MDSQAKEYLSVALQEAMLELSLIMLGMDCLERGTEPLEGGAGYTSNISLFNDGEHIEMDLFAPLAGARVLANAIGGGGEEDEIDEELMLDAFREMANILAGGLKSRLEDNGWEPLRLSIPVARSVDAAPERVERGGWSVMVGESPVWLATDIGGEHAGRQP